LPNIEHVKILDSGVDAWNSWRDRHAGTTWPWDAPRPNLSGADLRDRDLREVNFSGVHLYRTDLRGSNLDQAQMTDADLTWADLRGANLLLADLTRADLAHANVSGGADLTAAQLVDASLVSAILEGANLAGADLTGADLRRADLRGASLHDADLSLATLVDTRLQGARLDGCRVYGASVWNVEIDDTTEQRGLIITPKPPLLSGPPGPAGDGAVPAPLNEVTVTTDDLQIAQFLYLIRENKRLSSVIDAITTKVVLVLGNFKPQPKAILDAIRADLKLRDYVPVIFDFTVPRFRDTDETVAMLARMARFVIADATDARSLPQELKGIVEPLPSVPVQPIILAEQHEPGMFDHFKRYPWVLKPFAYQNADHLLAALLEGVIAPAEAMVKAIRASNP